MLKSYLRPIAGFYEKLVFLLFSPFFAFAGHFAAKPVKVGSVLHVSYMSHKPWMLARVMNDIGITAAYLVIGGEGNWLKMGDRGYDFNFSRWQRFWLIRPWAVICYVWFVMRRYDVIHYHFISLLTPLGGELRYLRAMGKLIVFHFRGCDIRSKSANNRINPELNCCQECDYPEGSCDTPEQARRIALARKYGDIFFVTTPDLLDFFPEAEHIPFIAPIGVDLAKIQPVERDRSVFRVVTSSNHDGVDGVDSVRQAVDLLKKEGRLIELVEVRKTPYEETLSIYKSADLYAGKLRMGFYNNAIIECMAMGVPCACYIRGNLACIYPDLPVAVSTPHTIYDKMKGLLDRRDELAALAAKGPFFVEKRHNPRDVAALMLKRYEAALARL